MLYDADRIEEIASVEKESDLHEAQLGMFLDPNDPAVIEGARQEGIHEAWLEAAKRSPVYRMAVEWKVAFPLHPEYRTLPMVWYVPPLSPMQFAAESNYIGFNGAIPDIRSLQIPVKYLANLLAAGEEAPVVAALEKLFAMRIFMRDRQLEGKDNLDVLQQVGLSVQEVEAMYHLFAIGNYEDRYVIPTTHREYAEDAYDLRGSCGFSFGNQESNGISQANIIPVRMIGGRKKISETM